MSAERLSLLWGITMASGATAQLLARLTSLPGVVLLLASGLVVGRAGFHWVEPLDLGSGLGTVVGLLVSLVLFDGGLNLRLPGGELKTAVLRIVGVRVLVALGGGRRGGRRTGGTGSGTGAAGRRAAAATAQLAAQLARRDPSGTGARTCGSAGAS